MRGCSLHLVFTIFATHGATPTAGGAGRSKAKDGTMATKAEINTIRSLRRASERRESGLFVAEGVKLVSEAVASGWHIERLFALESCRAADRWDKAERVSPKEMERMSHLKTPSDVLALIRMPRHGLPAEPGRQLTLALDGVQDPGNLGTIMRLADWFGIGDVICSPDTVDCFSPKTVQATMGSVFRVRAHYTPLPGLLREAAAQGIPVYGTFLEGDDIYGDRLSEGGIIVLGNEGRGVSPEVAATVTRKLYIPPYPAGAATAESLNVSVAAAIVCSEFRRRTR